MKVLRTAVVTGGCGPLGWEISQALSSEGFDVVAVDQESAVQRAIAVGEGAAICAMAVDLSSPNELDSLCKSLSERNGGIACLVNNAALTGDSGLPGYAVPFEAQSDEAFDRAILINLAVPFRIVRRLTPLMKLADEASIINISSIYGLVGPDSSLYEGTNMGNPAAYAASKGGLVQLTRYLATVLAPDIRVNCVAPGGIRREQSDSFIERYAARTPLRRMASEDDIVGVIAFLASAKARYVTGQTIAVDGGWTAW